MRVVVVSGEPPWPSIHGGRIRTAGIAAGLSRHLDVCVLAPASEPPPAGLEHEELPDERRSGGLAGFASPQPAVGRTLLGPRRRKALEAALRRRRPDAVVFAQSPLAAVAPPLTMPAVVDFHDVEVRRAASLARRGRPRKRLVWAWEWAKATRWEPAIARSAALALAVTDEDAAVLSSWGGRALVVRHGRHPPRPTPSPAAGPVTFVAHLGYGPNLDGARFLIEQVWPRLHARDPRVPLRIVGWRAEEMIGRRKGIEVISNPADVQPFYEEASVLVAPVREGGGAQLKMVHALASGRTVVATEFSARSAPPGAGGAVVVARDASEFADRVLRLWTDLDRRRALERALRPAVIPTWEEAARPVADALRGMAGAA